MLIISNFIWSQIDIRPVNNMWCIGHWFLIQQEGSNSEHEHITIKFKKMNICCNISNYGSFKRKISNEEAKISMSSFDQSKNHDMETEADSETQITYNSNWDQHSYANQTWNNSDKSSVFSTNFASECKSEPDSSHNSESTSKTKANHKSTDAIK